MRYGIVRAVSSSPGFLEIEKAEYDAIRDVVHSYFVILGVEEKFDLLLSNYEEYEGTLLDLALGRMVRPGVDWDEFRDARAVFPAARQSIGVPAQRGHSCEVAVGSRAWET